MIIQGAWIMRCNNLMLMRGITIDNGYMIVLMFI